MRAKDGVDDVRLRGNQHPSSVTRTLRDGRWRNDTDQVREIRRRARADRVAARRIPREFDKMTPIEQLTFLLAMTLRGAAKIASRDPMKLSGQHLMVWNEIRKHTWNVALDAAKRGEDERLRAEIATAMAAETPVTDHVDQGGRPT